MSTNRNYQVENTILKALNTVSYEKWVPVFKGIFIGIVISLLIFWVVVAVSIYAYLDELEGNSHIIETQWKLVDSITSLGKIVRHNNMIQNQFYDPTIAETALLSGNLKNDMEVVLDSLDQALNLMQETQEKTLKWLAEVGYINMIETAFKKNIKLYERYSLLE